MPIILAIESSCDDTSAAIIENNKILANLIAGQKVHEIYGGVVPELASRAHQQNIIPVVDAAVHQAGVELSQIDAIAYTRGPGLMGSLLVGSSFAKAMSVALNIPLIDVDHLYAHILVHFIKNDEQDAVPDFPFICLLVSGGHTQIVLMKSYFEMEILGQTIDDAAGEAFDKAAKILGLPYPGGPYIDKLAKDGNKNKFTFAEPKISEFNYSFSGLKTSFLYFLRDRLKENPDFIQQNMNDLCASFQNAIVNTLMKKLVLAAQKYGVKDIAIAGGVSANSAVRETLTELGLKYNWRVFIPKFEYTTDNAAMIAITGYYKFIERKFAGIDTVPYSRA